MVALFIHEGGRFELLLAERQQNMIGSNYLVTRIHKITSLKVINKLGHHYKVVREHLFRAEQFMPAGMLSATKIFLMASRQ